MRTLLNTLAVFCVMAYSVATGMSGDDASSRLQHADEIKSGNPEQFARELESLRKQSSQLTVPQKQYLQYLQGWRNAFDGDYPRAIVALEGLVDDAVDINLQFRAGATVINVLVVGLHYEKAFSLLSQLLERLPRVTDSEARSQGLAVAAYLYNQVNQYDLGLRYAEQLIESGPDTAAACNGRQLKTEALFKGGKLRTPASEFQAAIDACTRVGQPAPANLVRTYVARSLLSDGQVDAALHLLQQHYDEVVQTHYPRLLSEFDALLADAHYRRGDFSDAQQSAQRAINSGARNEYSEPLVTAYRILYLVARQQDDTSGALAYHEKYAAADKGYLDDVSARQLAFHRVAHELTANLMQIESLHRQNELLELQRENNNLSIALLVLGLGFISYWAYKTKLSQLHFMRLSRHDGLTGIFNRHHFVEQASIALSAARESQHKLCVLLFDLDHFKSINDRYGHATGDSVLRQAVAACQLHLSSGDLFGRFGGEEFSVLLKDCDMEQAQQRAERMRQAIARISMHEDGMEPGVSASFGVAATPTSGYGLSQLLSDADAALYRAKRAGRNRVMSFDAADRSAAA